MCETTTKAAADWRKTCIRCGRARSQLPEVPRTCARQATPRHRRGGQPVTKNRKEDVLRRKTSAASSSSSSCSAPETTAPFPAALHSASSAPSPSSSSFNFFHSPARKRTVEESRPSRPGRARSQRRHTRSPVGQGCVDPLRFGFRREIWPRPRRWSVLSRWGVVWLVLHLLPALALHHLCLLLAVVAVVVSLGVEASVPVGRRTSRAPLPPWWLVTVLCARRPSCAVSTFGYEWWDTVASTAATVCCSCRHHERSRRCLRRFAALMGCPLAMSAQVNTKRKITQRATWLEPVWPRSVVGEVRTRHEHERLSRSVHVWWVRCGKGMNTRVCPGACTCGGCGAEKA